MSEVVDYEIEHSKRRDNLPAVETGNVILSRKDMEAAVAHRAILNEYVSKQLMEGINHDFAIIPGTPKKSLLKPGAEKLLKLFKLGVKVYPLKDLTLIDIDRNYAQIAYRADVFHLQTGIVISSIDRLTTNQEDKFKTRTKWEKSESGAKVSTKEETPVGAILNNLMAMAQKRAIVAATIVAVGASDFFTQEMEDEGPRTVHTKDKSQVSGAPNCCGRPMMVSKFNNDPNFKNPPFYCVNCKKKVSRDEEDPPLGKHEEGGENTADPIITENEIPF